MADTTLMADTLELANDVIRERLELQRTAIERIETKATLLLGFAAAGIQVLLLRGVHGVPGAVAITAFALSMATGLGCVAVYEHHYPPEPGRIVDAYLAVSRAHLLDVLVRTRTVAYFRNAKVTRRKRVAWLVTLFLLAIGAAASGLTIARSA